MKDITTYEYHGQTIARCERAAGEHRGRWIIWGRHHATGMLLSDELCSHHMTLAWARRAIDDNIATA